MENKMKKRWISLYVENQVGVLSKITGLFSGKTYNLASGENSISEIIFTAGENLLEFIGTGTVAVSYQEASL